MNSDVEQALRLGFGAASPEAVVALLEELAGHVAHAPVDLWGRHEVFPAAVEARDALCGALRGRRRLSVYETHRLDARQLGTCLELVVSHHRNRFHRGDDVDREQLLAYEDELQVQRSPDLATPYMEVVPRGDPTLLTRLLAFVLDVIDAEPDASFTDETVLAASEAVSVTLQHRVRSSTAPPR